VPGYAASRPPETRPAKTAAGNRRKPAQNVEKNRNGAAGQTRRKPPETGPAETQETAGKPQTENARNSRKRRPKATENRQKTVENQKIKN